MKRRGFLQGLFCVGALAGSLPRLAKAFVVEDDGVALVNVPHPVGPFSNVLTESSQLSEQALLDIIEVTRTDKYLTSDTRWYLKTEPEGGLKLFHRERSGEGLARALEDTPFTAGRRYSEMLAASVRQSKPAVMGRVLAESPAGTMYMVRGA